MEEVMRQLGEGLTRCGTLAVALFVGVAWLVSPPAVSGQDLDGAQRQRMYYQTKPAVVYIQWMAEAVVQIGDRAFQVQDGGGGSGYIVSPDGYLLTNGHAVEGYHESQDNALKVNMIVQALQQAGALNGVPEEAHGAVIVAYLPRQIRNALSLPEPLLRQADQVARSARITPVTLAQGPVKRLAVVLQNGRSYPAEVKEYSPPISSAPGKTESLFATVVSGRDVAVLKIAARDLPTVSLGDSDVISLGGTVHAAGYPGAVFSHESLGRETILEASFTRGEVSSLKVDVQGSPLLQHTAAITWGNSGGPLFNDRGEVVGMNTMISIAQGQAIHGFGFAVPVNVVREFLRSAGADVTQRSLFDRAWSRALDNFFQGNHQAAISEFDMAMRLMPDLPDADRLRRAAISGEDVMRLEMANQPPPPAEPEVAPPPVVQEIPQGENGSGPSAPWILAGLALLSLVLVPTGVVMRRRALAGGAPGGRLPAVPSALPKSERALGHLVVRSGPLKGNRFPVPVNGITIGRDPSKCQLVLGDAAVSREHALVAPNGQTGHITVRTLSGTNEVFVNDRPITETQLRSGDLIKVGSAVITFEQV
jgi:S1-C subfamily serine protease